MPFHDAGEMYKDNKGDVELVRVGGYTAKDCGGQVIADTLEPIRSD